MSIKKKTWWEEVSASEIGTKENKSIKWNSVFFCDEKIIIGEKRMHEVDIWGQKHELIVEAWKYEN